MKKFPFRAGSVLLAAALLASPATTAAAQDEATPTPAGTHAEQEPTTREHAPVTDHCPNSLTPPEPRTTSERLAPDAPAPAALPVAVAGDCGISAPTGFTVPEEVVASAWLVADIDTGEIVAQKDPHGRYRPASVIKALLALVAIEELDLQRPVTVSHASAAQEGSAVGLGEGGVYTVEQLLHGLLLASGNDAAHALAQELGGDEATLKKINAYAEELGTTDTRAVSYSGLDGAGMSSSAFDLGLIYRAAYADPVFARIVGTEFIDFPGYGEHEGYELWNDNGLFLNDPDGIGGKTGYTDDANHTFVGALDRGPAGGPRLMAILLDTTIDGGRPWAQAQALLQEAYRHLDAAPVGSLAPVTTTPAQPPTTGALETPVAAAAAERGDPERPAGSGLLGVGIVVAGLVAAAAALAGVVVTRRRR